MEVMKKKRVVVTGLGMVTALGLSVQENWQKALSGETGIRKITYPNSKNAPVQAVGEVQAKDWEVIEKTFEEDSAAEGEKRTLFALWSAQKALDDAVLSANNNIRKRYGVVLASGLPINRLEDIQNWVGINKGFDFNLFGKEIHKVHKESIVRNNSHRAAALIGKRFSLNGCNATITTACASATQAIGIGYRMIKRGDANLMVVGGAESMINPIGLVFFVLLKAASVSSNDPATVCRPFDRKRSGLVMGEGAAVAVLEEESHALERGARIYAEVAGYASSMDAYQVTTPHPKGIGAEKSMLNSLEDANLNPEDIDYINAHGTSTKLNDTAETLAIKRVFRDYAYSLAISSSKSMIGHLLAAAGGPEFIFTVLSVHENEIHPTMNLTNKDPKCDLNYVPQVKQSKTVRAAMSNSFGFGGQNASIVVRKYPGARSKNENRLIR